MAWTDEMVESLKQMWKKGLTTNEIAKNLGVSKNSIVGKVHRLNLTARPSPIKKKEDMPAPCEVKAEETVEIKQETVMEKEPLTPKTETVKPVVSEGKNKNNSYFYFILSSRAGLRSFAAGKKAAHTEKPPRRRPGQWPGAPRGG